jgi:hypothetical protein
MCGQITFSLKKCMGLYIGKYFPPRGISVDVIWGKIWKGEEKKGENVKEKGRTGKERK